MFFRQSMLMNIREKIGLIVIAVVLGGLFWWSGQERSGNPPAESGTEKKLSVVATFYPLEEFARAVGGDTVSVTGIVPAGSEPHEYEPTPQDILSAYEADVFIINGAGLDPWAEKIRPELERRGVAVIQMSERMALLPGTHEEGEGSPFDPHFWLDPVLARVMVAAIA
jgi:zinc transport system substrate-binding protein